MKTKRKAPKAKSLDKKDARCGPGTRDAIDLTEAEKLVGVHILGKEDTVRHFQSSSKAEQKEVSDDEKDGR